MAKQEKFVAYLRVSTRRQGESGLGESAQRTAVMKYLDGGELLGEFVEIESGADHRNRPKLQEALALCRLTGARLIVARLDRLSRDAEFLAGLRKSSVKFIVADHPNMTGMVLGILAEIAQDERETISTRIKAALAEIKEGRRAMKSKPSQRADGWVKMRLGPPPGAIPALAAIARSASAKGVAVRRARANTFAQDLAPIIEELRTRGIVSQTAIAAALNRRGIRTPRGAGGWTQAQVSRLLRRL